jgi:uncharacterized protein involved in type VI secretion and phage assembly
MQTKTLDVSGIHKGIVSSIESDPSNEFKILVDISDQDVKVWARVSSIYATEDAGVFFCPEIGDEVILGFLNNDKQLPVILGSLFNSRTIPSVTPTDISSTKRIVSKSKLTIEFDDKQKVLLFKTPGGNQIEISDNAKSIKLKDESENVIEMSPAGINISSQKNINFSAKENIIMDSVSGIKIGSKGNLNLSGLSVNANAQADIKMEGSSAAEISSAGETVVRGSIVMIN